MKTRIANLIVMAFQELGDDDKKETLEFLNKHVNEKKMLLIKEAVDHGFVGELQASVCPTCGKEL